MKLSTAKKGNNYVILSAPPKGELYALGVRRGEEVKLVAFGALKKTYLLETTFARFFVGQSVAQKIEVEDA